MAEVHNHEQV